MPLFEQQILNNVYDPATQTLKTSQPVSSGATEAKQTEQTEKLNTIALRSEFPDFSFVARLALRILRFLNADTAGRLRVASESTTLAANQDLRTITNVTNITNWGSFSATSKSQLDTQLAYQQGYRRNLVIT